ncbi:MAG: hypothetical protein HQL76_12090 [Magnetococcales bacterium]|nr:hypothetical protein [Magnetococcales bacterium]
MAEGRHDSNELDDSNSEAFRSDGLSCAQTPDAEAAEAAEARLARRRLLLKGLAAGVPAIVTLQSGAALAAQSTSSNCISNGGGASFNEARCKTATAAGTNNWKHVIDTDTSTWGVGGGPCPTTTHYGAVFVDNLGNIATGGSFGGNGTGAANPTTPASGYYAVRQSCWTSFH